MNEELNNILEKVRCLYLKYGIKSVTMDDVSRELAISKKTLYQYVKDKTELVEKVIELEIEYHGKYFQDLFSRGLSAIDELFEVQKHVSEMIKNHNPSQDYDLKKYYPDLFQRINKIRRERMYNYILENLRKGKREGLYRNELNEEIIAKVQLLRIEKTFDTEIFTAEEMASAKIFYEVFIYHLRGIASEKGLEELQRKLNELKNNI